MKTIVILLSSLILMFWNVENFFDPFDDPEKEDDTFTLEGENHWTWQRFQKKKNAVAKAIIATEDTYLETPALIGLCEVENRMVLRQLVEKSPLSEAGEYGFIHRESPDRRGIDVSLVYRKDTFRPIKTDSLRTEDFPTRDILYVKGVLQGPARPAGTDTLHIFVNHWPSKLGGARQTDERRDAVRSRIELFLDSLLSDNIPKDIVIMGDFNDTEPEIGIPGIIRLSPEGGGRASSPHGTLKYKGKWEQIDHFFISGSLLRLPVRESIYSPAFLLEEDKSFLGHKPRRTYVGPRYNGGVSDHLPIILSIGKK